MTDVFIGIGIAGLGLVFVVAFSALGIWLAASGISDLDEDEYEEF